MTDPVRLVLRRPARWRRGERIPDDARARLGLRRGERLLAAARQGGGGWLATTPQALLVEGGPRVEWTDVAHAQWLDEDRVLVVDPVPGAFEPSRFHLPDPGRVPETVHERVVASIVVTRRLSVPSAGGVRVVGRRSHDGTLLWQVVPDPGVDGDDPVLRAAGDAMIAQLRAELGL